MGKAFKCDFCGEYCDGDPLPSRGLDLCDGCRGEFKSYIDDKLNK